MTSNITKQTCSVGDVWTRNYYIIYYSWRIVNYSNHIFCIMKILKSGAAGKWMAMESVITHSNLFLINFIQIKGKKIITGKPVSKAYVCEMTLCFKRISEASSEQNNLSSIKYLEQVLRQ